MIVILSKSELPAGVVTVSSERHDPDDVFDGGVTIAFWMLRDDDAVRAEDATYEGKG